MPATLAQMSSVAPGTITRPLRFRSVFVSDTHLMARDSRAEVFSGFLDAIRCEQLYLVGDIMDLWYSRKNLYWPPVYNQIFRRILKLASSGTQVIYLPGNHDELFRKGTGFTFGNIQILEKAYHTTADGRRLLVIHGDQFDNVVKNHPWLTRLSIAAYSPLILINRIINAVRRMIGKPYWSFSGTIKRKVKQAVKFMNRFEVVLKNVAMHEGVQGVVCGHIHQPAKKQLGDILYLNSGDFIENCTAIIEDFEGNLEIIRVEEYMRDR